MPLVLRRNLRRNLQHNTGKEAAACEHVIGSHPWLGFNTSNILRSKIFKSEHRANALVAKGVLDRHGQLQCGPGPFVFERNSQCRAVRERPPDLFVLLPSALSNHLDTASANQNNTFFFYHLRGTLLVSRMQPSSEHVNGILECEIQL
jgi:hypothetical protein